VSDKDEHVDLDDKILAEFQRGIRAHLQSDYVRTHWDLGHAYAEMGLFLDAVAELELVLQAAPHHKPARSALALLHKRMGYPTGAGPIGQA
jgi:hypothetical protein